MKDVRGQVYAALAEVAEETGANQEEMEAAIEWYIIHFFEDE